MGYVRIINCGVGWGFFEAPAPAADGRLGSAEDPANTGEEREAAPRENTARAERSGPALKKGELCGISWAERTVLELFRVGLETN